MQKHFDELLEHIAQLSIIDTHEHLPMEAQRDQGADVLAEWLRQYFSCDLVSAGLTERELQYVRDAGGDLMQRWTLAEPCWEAARSTGYGRALDLAARGVYGVDGVSRETIRPLNEAFVAARKAGGHYRRVLKEKSRIALSVVDSNLDCDREFFASVIRLDGFVMPSSRSQVQGDGDAVGVRVHCLEDWEQVMQRRLDAAYAKGAVAIKCGLAYHRPLYFAKVQRCKAEEQFNELFSVDHSPAWRGAIKVGRELQDHMMHAVLRYADQRGLTVQFHTGLQEGHGNVIADANPTLLSNLLLEYSNVRFDLFHMGYPFVMELGNLAKNFRNAFIDMCWGHIISPEAARLALIEWLDTVPANKICAFGGDYCFVDGVYAHQAMARRNVAAALAQKVADGCFDIERAKQIAQWVFCDNPLRLLNLSNRVGKQDARPLAGKQRTAAK